MKPIFVIMLVIFGGSSAFAASLGELSQGPVFNSGSPATENLISKQKITAVMNAITQPNDVVEGVQLDSGRELYIVSVRNGAACSKSYYKVDIAKNSSPIEYLARYVDLIASGSCQ